MSASRQMLAAFVIPVALLGALQLVPYGRDHSAPADGATPVWDSPRTQQLAERACLDCHTNKTRWPWYANIAPVSWRIQNHVKEGREKLNFSAFDPSQKEVAEAAGEAGETVTKKEMPPFDYQLAHPEARLTADERRSLAAGLDATFAAWREKDGARGSAGANSSLSPAPGGRTEGGKNESGESESGAGDEDEAREHGRGSH